MLRKMLFTLPRALPKARRWVREMVREHDRHARPVDRAQYPRAVLYFPPAWLQRVRLAQVIDPPSPPLEEWDLGTGASENGTLGGLADPDAIALQDMVILRRERAGDESLLVHELIHVVQWESLGVNRFLGLYGLLLLERGYEAHPFEQMARDLQAQFDAGGKPVDLMTIARRRTQQELKAFRRRSPVHRLVFAMLGAD